MELAAAALATTLCNVTGLSLSVGLSSALTTLSGQARGDLLARGKSRTKERSEGDVECVSRQEGNGIHENSDESTKLLNHGNSAYHAIHKNNTPKEEEEEEEALMPLVYLYRAMFIQLLFVVPVGIWWIIGIKPALIMLGQGEELSGMTQTYLRILTPGLWSYSINWTVTTWLQCIEMADVPAFAAFLGCSLHIPMNLLFIHVFGWGYKGVGAATVLFQLAQPVSTILYLCGTKHGRTRLLEHTGAKGIGRTHLSFKKEVIAAITSLKGIFQYLQLALPGIVIISEWWASEITIFLAGRLQPNPEYALGAMSIYQSINSACFMFPVAFSIAGSARIGNLIGANDPNGADLASRVCVMSAALLSFTLGLTLYLLPDRFIPSLFTSDEGIVSETSRTIPLLSVYVFADGIQTALNGVMKGCGRQRSIWPIVIVAYWIVGMPLSYYLAFIRHDGYMCDDHYFCGIVGLVGGTTTGTWVHLILLALLVVCTTNWDKEAKKAQERLSLEKRKNAVDDGCEIDVNGSSAA